MNDNKEIRNVAVVYGGFSSEIEISIKSGKSVSGWLRNAGYRVYETVITREEWYVDNNNTRHPIDRNDFSCRVSGEKIVFDKVYIIIHGDPGENGILQAYFELIGVPFVGSSSLTTALAFDKYSCKAYLRGKGIPLADDLFMRKGESYDTDSIIGSLGLPLFVKPTNGGSSFGVSKVKKREELEHAISMAFREGETLIIESAIKGREIDCAVYKDSTGTHALPLIEIVSENEFFDYEAKYLGASEEICPAPLDDGTALKVRETAIKIFDILGCKGLVRADFIVTEDGTPYFLELNPNPGMTAASLVPQMVAHAGMRMEDFLSSIIEER